MEKDRFAIIGTGRVGTALGVLLQLKGYTVTALSDISQAALELAATRIKAKLFKDPLFMAPIADSIFITTPDDIIHEVCERLAQGGAIRSGHKIVHMSGAMGLDVLTGARFAGAHTASIHPVQSFTDAESAILNLPGSIFGITSDEAIREWSIKLVEELGGVPFIIPEEEKPLYHAAACIASNYVTTLLSYAEEIYQSLGLSAEQSRSTFLPLVRGTLANIEKKGCTMALTGPIVRGDSGTVAKHIHAFRKHYPNLLNMYVQLGIMTVDLALRSRNLSPEKAKEVRAILKGGEK
jgi:predicted short-subunit dehydrogenase-like oxidoreductase (DUF2520 family)